MRAALDEVSTALLLTSFALAADVNVGTYIINVGQYDITQGSYILDFYLWFEGDYTPNFEFTNGRAITIDKMIDKPGYVFYRIEGKFYNEIDLRDYPIDSQKLTIEIEDKILEKNRLKFFPI